MYGFKQLSLALATAGVLGSGLAQAALHDRGGGLLYDDVLDVTWLQDANYAKTSGYDADGRMDWNTAKTWAANLVFHDAVRRVYYSDWRLPNIIDIGYSGCDFDYSGTDCGYNVKYDRRISIGKKEYSELAYMYFSNLGLKSRYSKYGVYQPDSGIFGDVSMAGQANVGPVKNLQSFTYWYGKAYPTYPTSAWYFNTSTGRQDWQLQSDLTFAWAVRPGDVIKPKTYGLFIGVQQTVNGYNFSRPTLHDDTMARSLGKAFAEHGVEEPLYLTANLDAGEQITASQIRSAFAEIATKVKPGDTLLVYVGGHGGHFPEGGEIVNLGGGKAQDALADFQLAEFLRPFDKQQKITFVDACYGGGFWGSAGNPEAGLPQLDSLENIALFAAAPESRLGIEKLGLAFYDVDGGVSFFGRAVLAAANRGLDSFNSIEELGQFLKDETRKNSLLAPVWYEKDFGDAVAPDSSLISVFGASSPDFGSAGGLLVTTAVPESQTYIMFLAGLGLLTAFGKLRSTLRT